MLENYNNEHGYIVRIVKASVEEGNLNKFGASLEDVTRTKEWNFGASLGDAVGTKEQNYRASLGNSTKMKEQSSRASL